MKLRIALLSCLLLASACGGDDDAPDADTRIADLDDSELRTFCEAVIANDDAIDARIAAECPGRRQPHTRTVDDCVLRFGDIPDCLATVDLGEACLEASLEDACTGTLLLCLGFGGACNADVL